MKIHKKTVIMGKDELVKLNLGCGHKHKEGYINVDMDDYCRPDMLFDLDKGIPFEDNTVDEIYSEHLLEHVKDIMFVISEIRRVLKVGGKFITRAPHFSCLSAHFYQHYRAFRVGDFKDMGFKWNKIELVFELGIPFVSIGPKTDIRLNQSRFTTFYERFMILNHLIPAKEIYAELEKQI